MKNWLAKVWVYGVAYLHHFFRSALWVTLVCLALFLLFFLVPQAGELIVSQATRPQGVDTTGSFWARIVFMNFAAALLALSVWLSARILVRADRDVLLEVPPNARLEDFANVQAAHYVPRQLGLSIFLILQVAAAGSLSVQGYWLPVALVIVWLFILVMGLLRMSGVRGIDLLGWWLVLLFACAGFLYWAHGQDAKWLADRGAFLIGRAGLADAKAWVAVQTHLINVMVIAGAGACALLLAATYWLAKQGGARWLIALGLLAAVSVGVGMYQVELFTSRDLHWLFFLLQAGAASAYWFLVLHRQKTVHWFKAFLGRSGFGRWLLNLAQTNLPIVGIAVIGLPCALMIVWAAMDPISMGGYLGAAGIVLMFLALVVLFVAMLQAWIDKQTWGRAVPAGALVVLFLVFFFYARTHPQPPPSPATAESSAAAPVQALPLPADGPLFVVVAHGGGIRAAQYTAAFMAAMDRASRGEFSKRLVAASGASGGSVGLAVWSAARSAGCSPWGEEMKDGRRPVHCVDAVSNTLSQDHLAPLVATGLFRDFFWPLAAPERGNTLQESIAWSARLVSGGLPGNMRAHLERGLPAAPFPLLLNATQVGLADPFSFTTREGMLPHDGQRMLATTVRSTATSNISLITAAMHSARFPLISPKGLVTAGLGPTVVDGGYFDNSGTAVLRQHLRSMPDFASLSTRLVAISLDSEPIGSTPPTTETAALNSIDEIVSTILAARGAHGHAAWIQLCKDLGEGRLYSARPGAPLWTQCAWPTETSKPPGSGELWKSQTDARSPALGWQLSPRSALRVTTDAQDQANAITARLHTLGLPK